MRLKDSDLDVGANLGDEALHLFGHARIKREGQGQDVGLRLLQVVLALHVRPTTARGRIDQVGEVVQPIGDLDQAHGSPGGDGLVVLVERLLARAGCTPGDGILEIVALRECGDTSRNLVTEEPFDQRELHPGILGSVVEQGDDEGARLVVPEAKERASDRQDMTLEVGAAVVSRLPGVSDEGFVVRMLQQDALLLLHRRDGVEELRAHPAIVGLLLRLVHGLSTSSLPYLHGTTKKRMCQPHDQEKPHSGEWVSDRRVGRRRGEGGDRRRSRAGA